MRRSIRVDEITENQLAIFIPEEPVEIHIDRNSVVRLQNSLLNGKFKFNVHQWRLFLGFLASLYENDFKLNYYNLIVKDIYDLSGKDHKDALKLLRKDAKGLLAHVVEITKGDSTYYYNLFHMAKYAHKQGVLQLAPHSELLDFYRDLKNNFTDAYLKEVLKLSSSNSIKIYLMLKQFDDKGGRKITVENFRKQMGVEPGQYPRVVDLEKRFIQMAQRELVNTDMSFTYIRYGTPAKGFEFFIRPHVKNLEVSTEAELKALEGLKNVGLTFEQIKTVQQKVSVENINAAIHAVQVAKSDKAIKKTEAAWMVNYLKHKHKVWEITSTTAGEAG